MKTLTYRWRIKITLPAWASLLHGKMLANLFFDLLCVRLPVPCFSRRAWFGLLSFLNSSAKPAVPPSEGSVSRLMCCTRFLAWTSVLPQDTASRSASWIKMYCSLKNIRVTLRNKGLFSVFTSLYLITCGVIIILNSYANSTRWWARNVFQL